MNTGDTIGPYTLVGDGPVGKGTCKHVWKANRNGLVAMPVALGYFYHINFNVAEAIREATLWLQASGHINILPIQEFQEYDGKFCIVSEWVDGVTLDRWISETSTSRNILVDTRMMCGILAGVDHLHSKGVIHRDLKPNNIMVKGDTPLITDFGLSRSSQYDWTLDRSGTPMYMAPEAFRGIFNQQTDIWACGVVLYRILTGELPFGDVNEICDMNVPPRESPQLAIVPTAVKQVIRRALEKNPEHRYKSGSEMKKSIEIAVAPPIGIVTFMMTDIVGSTKIKLHMGKSSEKENNEEYFKTIHLPHNARLGRLVEQHNGIIIKDTGDGLFAIFPSPEDATVCAVEIQNSLLADPINKTLGNLQIRIGLNTGHAVKAEFDGKVDYKGTAIDLLSRIMENWVEGGEVVLSTETFALVRLKNVEFTVRSVPMRDFGDQTLHVVKPINVKDGQTMILIPAGTFKMGTRNIEVSLDAFYIGETPVTVGQYQRFCTEEGRPMPSPPEFNPNWIDQDHPMVSVTWDDATAYCTWAGGQLPTEAQWEKAARGSDGRKYPWGNAWHGHLCRVSSSHPGDHGNTAPVGSYPAGASFFGVLDMAGNVFEWCFDTQNANSLKRAVRGGSWKSIGENACVCMQSMYVNPTQSRTDTGLRIVRETTTNTAILNGSQVNPMGDFAQTEISEQVTEVHLPRKLPGS